MSDGKKINETKAASKYNDKRYTRVTTALGILDKGERFKMWLIKFSSYKEMLEALRKSAERGSKVDEAVKALSSGLSHEVEDNLSPYIRAYEKWRTEWKFNLKGADEEVSDDELLYVGTLDMYGELSQGDHKELAVLDIKTGEPGRDKEGKPVHEIFDSMFWQTAAYRHAYAKTKQVDSNWVLRLFSDGNYLFLPDKSYEISFEIFKHCLAIEQLRKNAKTNHN